MGRRGRPGWSYEALLPYFIRSEAFSGGASEHHGADGPMPVWLPDRLHPVAEAYMLAAEEAGYAPSGDHNGPRMEGPARNSLMIRDGRRVSAADAYLDPVLGRPNLDVVTAALVERVVVSRGRATGVEVWSTAERRVLRARTVVLAAGAVASPLILMRSGIGPPTSSHVTGWPARWSCPRWGATCTTTSWRPATSTVPGAPCRPRACSTPSRCSTSTTRAARRPTS